ncbi:taperin [Mustelus asterias]
MSVSEQRPAVLPLSPPQPHREEAAAGGARMPAWKRGILERRKAKLASPAVADSRSWIPSRAASHSNRAGEADRDRGEAATPAGAVLLESIAPIQENPFIQRERRRRLAERQAPGGGSARPVQQLLELYSHMPGVRTIQADNIIIIESDPDYFPEAGPARLHTVGELLSRAGQGSVAEIRAAEVLIYQGPLSRSEENLSTLAAEEPRAAALQGKVSRLLQKFDRNYAKPSRSRSTENLLDGFSPSPGRHTKPLLLPNPPSVSRQEGQARAGGSPPRGGLGSPRSPPRGGLGSPRSPPANVSPFQSKSSPRSSPTKAPGPLFPGRAPCAPAVPPHDQGEATLSEGTEGRPFSVSSYRKQFENVPANGWQLRHKELPPRKASSPRNNEKDWTTKEDSKLVENGHPESVETGSFSVHEGEMDSADRLDDIGSGRVPYSASASSRELSKGASTWRPESELNQRKASKSSPETPQPAAEGCSRPSSAKPSATPPGKVNQNHSVEGSAKITPNQCNGVSASTSLNNSFDIAPAKPPDFSSIPEGDIQARALANLKKQSRNSFVVIPKKRLGAYVESSEVCDNGETNKSCEKPKIENGASTPEAQTSRISAVSSELVSPSDKQSKKGKLPVGVPPLPKADFKPKVEETLKKPTSSGSYDVFSKHTNAQFSVGKETSVLPTEMSEAERNAESTVVITKVTSLIEDLPITNIDDVLVTDEKETSKQPTRASPAVAKDKPPEESFGGPQHPFVQRKSGNTFTVVPQRKPAEKDRQPSVNANEISQENGTDEQSVEDSETSLAKLGVLLKKRYPLAEDIQVIGGYLSLERSCLSKAGSTRKKDLTSHLSYSTNVYKLVEQILKSHSEKPQNGH